MPPDIPTFCRNRSLGLGTSKRGSILPKPNVATQTPSFLDFCLDNFEKRKMHQKDVVGHYGCINAIEISPNEELVASGGDDKRIVIWATDELLYNREPKMRGKMARQHKANIFALGFDPDSRVVYSGGNDHFFVSSDISTGAQLYGVQGFHSVHDLSVNKRSGEVLVTRDGGDDALFFHDPRTNRATASITSKGMTHLFSAQFNPDPSTFLIGVCGENFGVRFIDRRNLLKPLFSHDTSHARKSAMYGGWNKNGTKFAHLASNKAPVVYDFRECVAYQTDPSYRDSSYKNMCTVKSIEWIDDDWLITGSDDFNIYGWNTRNVSNVNNSIEVREESNTRFKFVEKKESDIVPKAKLVGHRSVVNHARFSSRYQFLVSCGVEKIIKVWNTRPFTASFSEPRLRRRGTTETIEEEGSERSMRRRTRKKKTDESGRMLRYFDRLVAGENDPSEDEDTSEEEESDDDSRPGPEGNIRVEDTDERDGVDNVPETRIMLNKGRSYLHNDDARGYIGRMYMEPPDSSDYSNEVSDIIMSSDDDIDLSELRRGGSLLHAIELFARASRGRDMNSPDSSPTPNSTPPSESHDTDELSEPNDDH